ncbi:MAG: YicC/YloC family endoribonuclease [Panacagrimonas sp.]
MIRSMTGYARLEGDCSVGRVVWEMRAVNHRYLDVSLRLPEDFRRMEPDLRQLVSKQIGRGKIECSLRYRYDGAQSSELAVDTHRVQQLQQAMDQVAHIWGPMGPSDPLRLLSFAGVIREPEDDLSPLLATARELFNGLLKAFDDSRLGEGARMHDFLVERCDNIEALVAQVRPRYQAAREQWVERLRQRALEMKVELDPQRFEQELAIAAQRLDVEEELSRLASHLVEVRQVLKRDKSVGRRLDFLMQELNREANTLSSKSQDAEMTRLAVEMKVQIEQMREQVQNIE